MKPRLPKHLSVLFWQRSLSPDHRRRRWLPGRTAPRPQSRSLKLFAPTSRLQAHHYLPSPNVVIAVTTESDHIVCGLRAFGDVAPSDGRPTVYLDQNHLSTLFKARYSPERAPAEERAAAVALTALPGTEDSSFLPASAGTYAETTRFTDDVSLAIGSAPPSSRRAPAGRCRIRSRCVAPSSGARLHGSRKLPDETFAPGATLEPNAIHGPNRGNQVSVGSPNLPGHLNYALAAVTSYPIETITRPCRRLTTQAPAGVVAIDADKTLQPE